MWLVVTRRAFPLYLLYLCGLIAVYYFRWPLFGGDTDLWYHLNGGRYISEHHRIPTDSSFFSFISPPRPWVDYYWLFQVVVYQLYRVGGYEGLLVIRNAAYVATLALILFFLLLADRRRPDRGCRLYLATLFSCYAFFLLPRYLLVRPHIFTYLFIVTFILAFELFRQRVIWLLPVAILWCNVHGGEYPVMLLIIGAYLAEWFVGRLRRKTQAQEVIRTFLIPAMLLLWTVWLTPHGFRLFPVPFSTAHAPEYIAEYQLLTWKALATHHFFLFLGDQQTIFNILFAVTWVTVLVLAYRRRLKISHAMMVIGGSVILLKGNRFTYECLLLFLPLLAMHAPSHLPQSGTKIAASHMVFGTLLLLLPPAFCQIHFSNRPRHPLSALDLPSGVVRFLKHIRAPGDLLNFPNRGGYYQWELTPHCKIFMDMQCPLLFTDADMRTAVDMLNDEEVLGALIARYQPSFIAVPIESDQFGTLIRKFPEYALVFFDDAEVLYVNRHAYPAVAKESELKALEPFALAKYRVSQVLGSEARHTMVSEARKMLAIYPDSLRLNELVAMVLHAEGADDRALPFAEAIIRSFPDAPTGYGVKGNALKGLGYYRQALTTYRMALPKSSPAAKKEVYFVMGLAYRGLGENAKAYRALKKAVDAFSPTVTIEELYWLGSSALLAGHEREGMLFLRFAAEKVSPKDGQWYEDLRKIRRSAEVVNSR